MKNILFLFAFGLSHLSVFGQGNLDLTVHYTSTPGPFWYGETTSFGYDYRINGNSVNLPSLCNEAFSVLGNTGGVATKLPTGNVNVVWGNQKSTDARLNIHLTNCSSQANNGSRPSPNYSVMSITQETPAAISGTGDVAVCQSTPITYSTNEMSIPNGVNRAVDGYEWTIPIG